MMYFDINIARRNHFVSALFFDGKELIQPLSFTNDALFLILWEFWFYIICISQPHPGVYFKYCPTAEFEKKSHPFFPFVVFILT